MRKFICLVLLLVFGMVVVSSQAAFSGSVNRVQYTNPSVQSIYGSNIPSYWQGASGGFDESHCDSGTDFVLMIPPAGCQPMAVRSDLLSSQNVPVMCQLASVRVNPLIRVSSIRSIGFSGDMPSEVAGVSFYPARAATRSYNSLLGDPIYNNVGYVVITLKRNQDESSMPKFVEGNLTARISYDSERAFGVGNAVLFLEEGSEKDEASFWGGQGRIKMLSTDGVNARFGIYSQEGQLVREVVLKEGETSGKIYLPGFYCQASFRLKLSDFDVPQDSALLNIDGEDVWVRRGSQILNGRCNVRDLDLHTGKSGMVSLDCQGAGRIELSLVDSYSANFTVNGQDKLFNLSDKVTTGNLTGGSNLDGYLGFAGNVGGTRDSEGIVVLLGSNQEIRPEVYSEVARAVRDIEKREGGVGASNAGVVQTLKNSLSIRGFTKDVSLIVLGENDPQAKLNLTFNKLVTQRELEQESSQEVSINETVRGYLNEAKGSVEYLIENYKNVKGEISIFAETALLEQINLLDQAQDINAMMEAMDLFLETYPESVHAKQVEIMLEQERNYDTRNARTDFSINGQHYFIALREFSPVKPESKSARVYVGNSALGEAGVLRVGDLANLTENRDDEKIRIDEIYPNRVVAEILTKNDDGEDFNRLRMVTLRFGESQEIKINKKDFLLEVNDIDVDIVTRIEIQTDADNKRSEANFTYKVGIEQRTIQLNPNKSSEKAARLNETIKKWEERNDKLGSVIEAWKGACLLTGLSLNVLNMVRGHSGESLARQEVMKAWRVLCNEEDERTSLGTKRSIDACYNEHSREIGQDVEAYTKAVQDINKEIREAIEGGANVSSFVQRFNGNIVVDGNGKSMPARNMTSWEQVRAYMLNDTLGSNNMVSPWVQEQVKKDMETRLMPAIDSYMRLTAQTSDSSTANSDNCENKIVGPEVTYYESGNAKGLAAMVPFDKEKGWYVRVSSSVGGPFSEDSKGYTSAAIPETITICNVGRDGMQGPADDCATFSIHHNRKQEDNVNVANCLIDVNELDTLLRDAREAIRQANQQYTSTGKIRIHVRKLIEATRGSPQAQSGPIEQCQDFMSPENCNVLFNVCDPVMCPPSRFNFGGKYNVPNVIQSGVVGSLVLGLPNFKPFGGDVYVPICLTGVHAGIDGWISVLKAQIDCLEENARTGNYVGMCDYMTKIYKCNLLWNFVGPQMSNLLPSLFSLATGKERGGQGGGEYLAFQTAWDNMESSLDFFQNKYGSTSFSGIQFGNVEQFGTEVCNAFVGTSFPTSSSALDRMLKPDSPYQLYGEFHEVPHTDATVPSTSQYNVMVHLYAGNDQGVSYSVYLKNPPSSGYYTSIPFLGVPRTGTGFVPMGEYVQISESFTAPAGYKELCVSVNGVERCNFGPVTTDFAIQQLANRSIENQASQTNIRTERECQQGTSGVVGFTSINPQAAVTDVVDPRIDLQGVVRVCSSVNPGSGTARQYEWQDVGYCGDQNMRCWLDKNSVSQVSGQVLDVAETIRRAETAMRDIGENIIPTPEDNEEKLRLIREEIYKDNFKDNVEDIQKNLSDLHDNSYSIRYQAEAKYWEFKLYERVVRSILDLSGEDLRLEVRSPIVSENEEEETSSGDPVLRDLTEGQMVRYNNVEYRIKGTRTIADGSFVVTLENSQDRLSYVKGSATDTLKSEGITIINS